MYNIGGAEGNHVPFSTATWTDAEMSLDDRYFFVIRQKLNGSDPTTPAAPTDGLGNTWSLAGSEVMTVGTDHYRLSVFTMLATVAGTTDITAIVTDMDTAPTALVIRPAGGTPPAGAVIRQQVEDTVSDTTSPLTWTGLTPVASGFIDPGVGRFDHQSQADTMGLFFLMARVSPEFDFDVSGSQNWSGTTASDVYVGPYDPSQPTHTNDPWDDPTITAHPFFGGPYSAVGILMEVGAVPESSPQGIALRSKKVHYKELPYHLHTRMLDGPSS